MSSVSKIVDQFLASYFLNRSIARVPSASSKARRRTQTKTLESFRVSLEAFMQIIISATSISLSTYLLCQFALARLMQSVICFSKFVTIFSFKATLDFLFFFSWSLSRTLNTYMKAQRSIRLWLDNFNNLSFYRSLNLYIKESVVA